MVDVAGKLTMTLEDSIEDEVESFDAVAAAFVADDKCCVGHIVDSVLEAAMADSVNEYFEESAVVVDIALDRYRLLIFSRNH